MQTESTSELYSRYTWRTRTSMTARRLRDRRIPDPFLALPGPETGPRSPKSRENFQRSHIDEQKCEKAKVSRGLAEASWRAPRSLPEAPDEPRKSQKRPRDLPKPPTTNLQKKLKELELERADQVGGGWGVCAGWAPAIWSGGGTGGKFDSAYPEMAAQRGQGTKFAHNGPALRL